MRGCVGWCARELWEIASRGPAIRHRQRVVNEGGVTHDIGDRGESVPWAEHDLAGEVSDAEAFAIREELVPLRAISSEAVWEIVKTLPEPLDLDNLFTRCRASARLVLQVTRR